MPTILETLASASADYLHSRSIDTDRVEGIRAAIFKQWKELDEPNAKYLSETAGIGTYKMVFVYEPDMDKEEFEQLIPEELKNLSPNVGSVWVYWSPILPQNYEIHLNFETQRNWRLRELKEADEKKRKEKEAAEEFREFDTSVPYTRCPRGYHFIDDEGHIARTKKRERDDDDGAEKDYERPTRYGVAAKRVRIENLKTAGALLVMDHALESIAYFGYHHIEDKKELALAWEQTLLGEKGSEVRDTFASAIKLAEAVDAANAAEAPTGGPLGN